MEIAAVIFLIITLVFCGVLVYVLSRMLKAIEKTQTFHIRSEAAKQFTPIKIRAYERMAIFLERISPDSLIMRQNVGNNISCQSLQNTLLTQIRQEWEHNSAQRIYIKEETWELISDAKESIIDLINSCAEELKPNMVAMGLAQNVLDTYDNTKLKEETLLDKAMSAIRKDIAEFCG